jgi:hypothetical protein
MVAAVFGTLATFAPRPIDGHAIDRVVDPFTLQQPSRS